MKEDFLKRINKVLSAFKEIEVGFVFGSFIEADSFEDIDVALLISEVIHDPYEQMKFAMKVGRKLEKAIQFRYEVDVKILNSSPNYFQYEVIKDGKLVFCRDEVKRIRYEDGVLSNYLDYKETLEWLNQRFLAGIR